MEIIKKMPTPKVVEVGSGGGWFLSELSKLGVNNFGVELNPQAKEIGRANGLTIYSTEDASYINENASVLCLFQTLEHVQDPVKFLNTYIKIFEPRTLLISTPCIESLLGHTNDPLCWPPHHATAWSEKSFKVLAEKIGCVLTSISYEALNYQEFESRLRREGSRKLFNMPYIPPGFLGRAVYYLASMLKAHWAVRSHSILGVFVRERA
jgi:2-polyprenyl-3-methyl-5-hydroxy-6-metoxy-1,4-benzoquinol methylase